MAGFQDIVGHNKIIEHLKNAIKMDKVSHAYIINGEDNSGKMMLAETFAMALQCEEGKPEPCGNCRSCRQAKERNQPDIIFIGQDEMMEEKKTKSISVDEIRTLLNNDIVIKPYSSKYKIYIVDHAEKMNVQAQNALLKTIEEPPAYGVILLLTSNADSFLQTIRSRCILLNIKTVEEEQIKKHLMKKYQVPDYKAEICAAFAQGNVGKAIQLASSDSFNEMKQDVLSLVKKMEEVEIYELPLTIKNINTYKQSMEEYLDLMTLWYRDVLYLKSTDDVNNLIFKDEVYDIKKQAAKKSFSGIENILQAIELTRTRLKANVNFDLVIEMLLLAIKEN
ncbi:MAG: DNA polymerase III subunit [Agathobacter sp.]|nr:DNA polymerase III subunit [Agathobacter sp.]